MTLEAHIDLTRLPCVQALYDAVEGASVLFDEGIHTGDEDKLKEALSILIAALILFHE